MENKSDHPGVYLPPPLLYAAVFLAGVFAQKFIPLGRSFFHTTTSRIVGTVIVATGVLFVFPALRQFFRTGNSVVTIKPANSLQTTGIYSITRNPMYVGLLLFYTGLVFIVGNWWTFILIPMLVILVQQYIIKREEKYLARRFGQPYSDYKTKVRRWL